MKSVDVNTDYQSRDQGEKRTSRKIRLCIQMDKQAKKLLDLLERLADGGDANNEDDIFDSPSPQGKKPSKDHLSGDLDLYKKLPSKILSEEKNLSPRGRGNDQDGASESKTRSGGDDDDNDDDDDDDVKCANQDGNDGDNIDIRASGAPLAPPESHPPVIAPSPLPRDHSGGEEERSGGGGGEHKKEQPRAKSK
tara:strand:+ start:234 stop:815 length:582 start_codon:yes stop_codon:yes gene_type:complete